MAEETQEELSMEDILSSIKDILMDDHTSQQQTTPADDNDDVVRGLAISATKADIVEDVIEDVLDLSPSMIVTAEDRFSAPEPERLDFDAEFEDLPSEPLLDDIDEAFALSEIDDIPASSVAAEVAQDTVENFTISDSETLHVETEEAILSELSFEKNVVDVESEPIYSLDDDDLSKEHGFGISETEVEAITFDDAIIDDATLDAILNAQPADPIIEVEDDFVEPTDNTYEAAFEVATQAVIKEATEEIPEGANIDDAVDLSASIISNFAKMFANTQEEKSVDVLTSDDQDDLASKAIAKINLGNGNLTIEAIVRDIVTDIVEKNLQSDYNFVTTASEEIARQTKIWLNDNLPSIVEATVQKEIERVMAKVSS